MLPARAGEFARVAVLRRHLPHGRGTSATLLGTVFAHRLFDLFPVAILVTWVLLTAKIPHWAVTSLIIFGLVGFVLLMIGLLFARTGGGRVHDGMGSLRALLIMARQGLAVLRRPVPALGAAMFQLVGWLMQLFAVWAVMEAFNLDLPLPAAGLVLVLMNVAIIFPLWPGNIGLLQAAVALPLGQYGVPYGTGFAYGLVLQAVEMSVGVGVGLIFLAREGLSLASLKTMEEQQAADETALVEQEEEAERGASRQPSSGLNEPRRSATSSLGGRVRRAVARDGRDEDVALERDELDVGDGGHGGRARHVAEERDLAERLAGAERAPEDLDLAALDHVEAVAASPSRTIASRPRAGTTVDDVARNSSTGSGRTASSGRRAAAPCARVRATRGRSPRGGRATSSVAAGSSDACRRGASPRCR